MSDFFDLPDDNFVSKGNGSYEKKEDPNLYNPDPNAHNGVYKSVIRFVPYQADKKLSKLTKYSAKFWNPLTKESLFVDCPSNEDKPSILWDIHSVIRGLEKEEPTLFDDLNKRFSRWYTHHSPVYIKKDLQRPDLNGTIKIFKYAKQVNDLIEAQINPPADELVETSSSVNPFHLLHGKDFLCVVGKKTKTFRDWTKCKFMDEIIPLIYNIGDTKVTVENSEKSVKLVAKFLESNTPKMDEYFHKSWDEDTYEKVAKMIISTINNRTVINRILDRTKDEKMKALILEKLSGKSGAPVKSDSAPTSDDDELSNVAFEDNSLGDELETASDSHPNGSSAPDDYDDLFKDL